MIVRPIVPVITKPVVVPVGSGHDAWEAGAGGGLYDPYANEPTCIFDAWAERGVTEAGTGIASWLVQPGSMDYVQASDGDRPSYNATGLGGRPTVDFILANTDVLRLASGFTSLSMDITVICAMNLLSRATTEYLLDIETGRLIFSPNRAGNPHLFEGSWIDTGAVSVTGAAIRRWRLNDTANQFSFFRGNTQIGSTSAFAGHAIAGASGIGDGHTASEGPLDARVGRLMVFNTVDQARDARVLLWMASHYSIAL